MTLSEWALKWGISNECFGDLVDLVFGDMVDGGMSEQAVQSRVRLKASQVGMTLFRNNVGAFVDERGVPVRYGLANDSKKMNQEFKSADLIGIKPVTITPDDVGRTIGQFVSIEVKRQGRINATSDHIQAQIKWATFVLSKGGDARIINNPNDLEVK